MGAMLNANVIDSLTDKELDVIGMMVNRALLAGVAWQVVASFGNYRAGGENVLAAAHRALIDWNL